MLFLSVAPSPRWRSEIAFHQLGAQGRTLIRTRWVTRCNSVRTQGALDLKRAMLRLWQIMITLYEYTPIIILVLLSW